MVVAEVADAASASLLDDPDPLVEDELGASVVEAPSDPDSVAEVDSVADSAGLAV